MLRTFIFKKKNIGFIRKLHTINKTFHSDKLLTPGCIEFLKELNDRCSIDYQNCIQLRKIRLDDKNYDFRKDTSEIRNKDWKIKIPDNLKKRHVELTGPGNNKRMIINALNSNADGYMLDLEDSMFPSWNNVVDSHLNINEAIRGTLNDVKYDDNGEIIKKYNINESNLPLFFVRPRGLNMMEHNIKDSNNNSISATIFDIGIHLYNNGKYLSEKKKGPYLYIPKLESYEDALFINSLISKTESMLGIPYGTTKITVLIETFPAIFETDEIIYALKDHIVALNCGRWDYLYSMIKTLGNDIILPDKNILTMDKPFLESYVNQIVNNCHKRGILAMGGMSANIPSKDKNQNDLILKKIQQDKLLEIERGCDGTWVAHPGMVDYVKDIYQTNGINDNQINKFPKNSYMNYKHFTDIGEQSTYSIDVLKSNINISLQYISAWLSGTGAVELNGLMEDLATAEISIHQTKQWYNASLFNLNKSTLSDLIHEEYEKILNNNQVNYASQYFDISKYILEYYLFNEFDSLPKVAEKFLYYDKNFKGIKFSKNILNKLKGSNGYLSGIELTKKRGEFLNKFLYSDKNDSYKFLGTSNGISAVNVVAGGNGKVGPYAGGWQTNAMKNRLGMLLPDTLHVSPEEAANCAQEINNHLDRADKIQHLNNFNNVDFNDKIDYHNIALLADMEQGWNTPEKIKISVQKAIENGINVIHIEDQGEKKRCGHLGDKELNTYEHYALILRSANLASQDILGSQQANEQWVRFVARTDAYSAKRIVNSSNLWNKDCDEYKFIDWDKGISKDGKYLFLKQGINPDTGKKWGLELSIQRCAKVVDEGLASHVWMETPDADLHVAKDFIDGVNQILLPLGKKAYGLYNHSPSFDWDIKFFSEAKPISIKIVEKIIADYIELNNNTSNNEVQNIQLDKIQNIITDCGDKIKGDHQFNDENLLKIYLNAYDHYHGIDNWNNKIDNLIKSNETTAYHKDMIEKSIQIKKKGFRPIDNITDIIVDQRLINFSKMLSSFGFNMHLITLPEFHITAYNMHKLSKNFSEDGINAFVKDTQRPERITSENDHTYTYYKHQTATGTGLEACFSEAVGSTNVNMLSESTELDDLKLRNTDTFSK